MEVSAVDVIKIRGFLQQWVEVLKARGTQSDGYAAAVIEDRLGWLK